MTDELNAKRNANVRDEIRILTAEVKLMRKQLGEMRTHMGSSLQFNDDSLKDIGYRIDRLSEKFK